MIENKTAGLVGHTTNRLLEPAIVTLDEEVHQRHDVFFAVAQRRDKNRNNGQPVIKILTKLAIAHRSFEIAVGGSNHAHIHLHIADAAHAADDLVFQHAQQFGLQQGRELADLVEKKCPAVGGLEQPFLHLLGVGERAFLVAEELGFHQRLGDGRAVDGYEGLLLARTFVVDGFGDEVLAGAAFALNQNGGGFAGRNLADEVHQFGHLG